MELKSGFADGVLERFLRYVAVDTQAKDDQQRYPSTDGQLELGKMLAAELHELGVSDVEQDEHGYVFGTIPASEGCEDKPVVALLAHVDTSPEKSGANIKAIVHKNYQGGDIDLPGLAEAVITPADNPSLADKRGEDIVTSDGSTLLGADDKAGIAEIITAAAYLLAHPEHTHGPVRIVFTCDEEIGRGVEYLDLNKVGAHVGYTLDGESLGELEGETFSADLAVVTCKGFNTHPGFAKGKMINALKMGAAFIELLPQDGLAPEMTEDLEGFVHPYVFEGGVDETTIKIIVRDFETEKLYEYEKLLQENAAQVEKRFGGSVKVECKKQYRNMRDGMQKDPRAMELARQAMKMADIPLIEKSIRGGTDGSRLTEMGLPTPNLFAGGHNFHSNLEWVSVQDMEKAVAVTLQLVHLWAQ